MCIRTVVVANLKKPDIQKNGCLNLLCYESSRSKYEVVNLITVNNMNFAKYAK